MGNCRTTDILVSGIGITSAIGNGTDSFTTSLLEGRHAFDVLRRPGRQCSLAQTGGSHSDTGLAPFIGAEMASLLVPERIPKRLVRAASLSGRAAMTALGEAWQEAKLGDVDPARIGLIIGGSNCQQREAQLLRDSYREKIFFLPPQYAIAFLDMDLIGLCTEAFGIRGPAYTVGGASASGQLAVIEAAGQVCSGDVDVGVAVGALMDLSYWELQGLRTLGAMGSARYASAPACACRPYDKTRDGFIYGESCGAVVVERETTARQRGAPRYGRLTGWAIGLDGNRSPNPSLEGEMRVITQALSNAGLTAQQIDYINPHGTGSVLGDATELQAINRCNLTHARINATKSITGHGISSAGVVEIIATLVQMRAGRLHPTRNLDDPIESDNNWVAGVSEPHAISHALSLSMGFGGMNTAVCIERVSEPP